MLFLKLLVLSLTQLSSIAAAAATFKGSPKNLIRDSEPYQSLVTWDEHSLFVKGDRVLFYSGEFHPFRLPVPGLWLDVFQKIKALGYNGVSFYTDFALHEYEQGVFRADGIFGYEDFFDAATQAGIWLLARPGPYINAEVFGGGYPGWMTRINGQLRTNDTAYIDSTAYYIKEISAIISKAQITNGGPVILFQPENEYTNSNGRVLFPNKQYFYDVEKSFRDAGIVVPLISNDASPKGYFAPGTGLGAVDIYGYDGYPLGFDCSNPSVWPENALPTDYRELHNEQNPTTPNSIIEFQGGSFDPWGGVGFEKCTSLLNSEFERVFYRNNFGAATTIFNIYMTYGGTNWGNLGHPSGYTSYDYGAVIKEDRTVDREKYSEAKLLANGLMASLAYLTAIPAVYSTSGAYTNTADISIWPAYSNKTGFYVIRHTNYSSTASTAYKLTLPTSQGNITVPQMGGSLKLDGRDSKMSVTDYDVGGYNLLYNTADIFTWKQAGNKVVLIVYGGPGEQHELAFSQTHKAIVTQGTGVKTATKGKSTVLNWTASADRKVVQLGSNLFVYLLDRNTAFNYWVIDSKTSGASFGSQGWGSFWHGGQQTSSALVLRAGYLVRSAETVGKSLSLVGDLNATVPLEIISGAPSGLRSLKWNNSPIPFKQDRNGVVTATLQYTKPDFKVTDLSALEWKYLDSLPEIQPGYDDAAWTAADHKTTPNIEYPDLLTPTSLYGGDYGYHVGVLVFRGHFKAKGSEKSLFLRSQGGYAFGTSLWLNNTYVGSYVGSGAYEDHNDTFSLPSLRANENYVLTTVIDTMGLNENYGAGDVFPGMKAPRGIRNFTLDGQPQEAITWKVTGNLGGEKYVDKVRGPLNEDGLFAERQGFHQPNAPTSGWTTKSPFEGIDKPGVGFFSTSFDLNIPTGYDVPFSFTFDNSTAQVQHYRAIFFVNGYQFGKYVANIGPQTAYPVPEGILNHQGKNTVSIILWAQQTQGAKLSGFKLVPTAEIQTGYGKVEAAPQPTYTPRKNSY